MRTGFQTQEDVIDALARELLLIRRTDGYSFDVNSAHKGWVHFPSLPPGQWPYAAIMESDWDPEEEFSDEGTYRALWTLNVVLGCRMASKSGRRSRGRPAVLGNQLRLFQSSVLAMLARKSRLGLSAVMSISAGRFVPEPPVDPTYALGLQSLQVRYIHQAIPILQDPPKET